VRGRTLKNNRDKKMIKSVLALLLCLPLTVVAGPHAIVIHGGAGTILRDNMSAEVEAEYRSTLTKAVTAGHQVLAGGGNSSDAVIQAVLILEDSPLFNAGRGAVFTNAGQVELDASIMRGDDLNAGAVTGVKRVRSPILLAQQVMLNSPHVMLMGSGAETFAAAQKLEMVDNDYFHTKRRRDQLQQVIAREQNASIARAKPRIRGAQIQHSRALWHWILAAPLLRQPQPVV
jgi:beta-aspartyl-peptidase (threonine type)